MQRARIRFLLSLRICVTCVLRLEKERKTLRGTIKKNADSLLNSSVPSAPGADEGLVPFHGSFVWKNKNTRLRVRVSSRRHVSEFGVADIARQYACDEPLKRSGRRTSWQRPRGISRFRNEIANNRTTSYRACCSNDKAMFHSMRQATTARLRRRVNNLHNCYCYYTVVCRRATINHPNDVYGTNYYHISIWCCARSSGGGSEYSVERVIARPTDPNASKGEGRRNPGAVLSTTADAKRLRTDWGQSSTVRKARRTSEWSGRTRSKAIIAFLCSDNYSDIVHDVKPTVFTSLEDRIDVPSGSSRLPIQIESFYVVVHWKPSSTLRQTLRHTFYAWRRSVRKTATPFSLDTRDVNGDLTFDRTEGFVCEKTTQTNRLNDRFRFVGRKLTREISVRFTRCVTPQRRIRPTRGMGNFLSILWNGQVSG